MEFLFIINIHMCQYLQNTLDHIVLFSFPYSFFLINVIPPFPVMILKNIQLDLHTNFVHDFKTDKSFYLSV